MRRPTGLWVVFLGPDGVGKSTLVRRVVADLSPAFRRTRSCHFRADVIADPDGRGAITDPHGRRPHGVAASLAQLALHLARNCIGYWTIVRPALTRSTLVAFDRYYHDILVDPRRYRYGGPRWLSAVIAALVPRPDLWIVLDAPTPAIAARKYELPPAEIERQAHAYRALARGLDGGQIIDAARPVTSVAHDVERLILAHMAARTTRRLAPVPAS
jgi:thymidylate kinase